MGSGGSWDSIVPATGSLAVSEDRECTLVVGHGVEMKGAAGVAGYSRTCITDQQELQFSFLTSQQRGIRGFQYLHTFPVLSLRSRVDLYIFFFCPGWTHGFQLSSKGHSPNSQYYPRIILGSPRPPTPNNSCNILHFHRFGFSISYWLYAVRFSEYSIAATAFLPVPPSPSSILYQISPRTFYFIFFGGRFRQVFPTPTNPP